VPAELVGAYKQPLRVSRTPVSASVPPDKPTAQKTPRSLSRAASGLEAATEPDRIFVNIENIRGRTTRRFFTSTSICLRMLTRKPILQFLLWWFAMPAIFKGWVDRVFAYGVGEHSDKRWDDHYGEETLAGKRAMLIVTPTAESALRRPRDQWADR
jgi:hypothetical protein